MPDMTEQQFLGYLGIGFAASVILLTVQIINRDRRAIWIALIIAVLVLFILATKFYIDIEQVLNA